MNTTVDFSSFCSTVAASSMSWWKKRRVNGALMIMFCAQHLHFTEAKHKPTSVGGPDADPLCLYWLCENRTDIWTKKENVATTETIV